MATDRGSDEMACWLRKLREYARGARFEAERRAACDEYLEFVNTQGGLTGGGAWVAQVLDPTGALVAAGNVPPGDEAARAAVEEQVAESRWFLFNRHDRRWDKTLVELFVAETPDLPVHVVDGLLACTQAVHTVFTVVAGDGESVVLADQGGAVDDLYRVRLRAEEAWLVPGLVVAGPIVRWAGEYRFLAPPARWPQTVADVLGPQAVRPAPVVEPPPAPRGSQRPVERVARRPQAARYSSVGWLRRRRDEG